MKSRHDNWDREPKIHKIEKGKNKAGKHRKNIYNMLSDYEDSNDLEFDSESGNVKHSYDGNFNYTKQR